MVSNSTLFPTKKALLRAIYRGQASQAYQQDYSRKQRRWFQEEPSKNTVMIKVVPGYACIDGRPLSDSVDASLYMHTSYFSNMLIQCS